ncbi:MAG: autotransporter domain-containing protein [Oceanicoccus sp.]|uniref:autotransporter domain-containing protein n=1 Tax=Oceanicoccus sp. TaxID=2691044 RepID=UPI0026372235|nr:autotransporter domain-containing protein [Oceanicoccus sp.]MDG1773228.1 autotransporter domain-containing protein [Oceanicoccus sp.]
MFKKSVALSIAALASLSMSVSAQSNFTELVVFGDSLMDTGNFGNGSRFTNQTSPGVFAPIAPDFLAAGLGLTLTPAIEGGTNYGVGGFRTANILQSVAGTGIATPAGTANAYLTNVGGVVPSGTLILIDGGGNDLQDLLLTGPDAGLDIPGSVSARADNFIAAIGALGNAGAQYVMVANVPDLGKTPGLQAAELGGSAGAIAGGTDLTAGYNGAVAIKSALGLSGVNIIPVDIEGFVDYIFANPDAYGFANGLLPGGVPPLDQLSMCYDDVGADCVEHPVYGIDGSAPDPRALIFNDALHPTEHASEIFGDYLNDIIQAPQTIGLLPELALTAARTQTTVTSDELRRSRWSKPEGRLFVAGDMASDDYENGIQPEAENTAITVGRTFVASETLIYGAALTFGQQELDVSGADLESDSWGLSALVGYRKGNLFIDTTAALSVLSYDGLKRNIQLGSNTITAEGDTDGHAWTIDSLVGYDILSSDTWHLAPALGVQYINTTVDSYSESGGEISNYSWGEQRRKSMVWRYGAVAAGQLTDNIRVFGEIFGAQEQENEDQTISITNTNLNFGAYSLPGFQAQDDSYITAAVGGSITVFDEASLNLSVNYSDRGDGYEQLIFSYSMPM